MNGWAQATTLSQCYLFDHCRRRARLPSLLLAGGAEDHRVYGRLLRVPGGYPDCLGGVRHAGPDARGRGWSRDRLGIFASLGPAGILGLSLGRTLRIFVRTLYQMRFSLIGILAMLGLDFLTRYSGMEAVMGLAMTNTGWLYPLFGTLIGWLGVALTGTDAGSNALLGSLQVITANGLGLSPTLMAAANSAGGVMGNMIDTIHNRGLRCCQTRR